MFDKAWRRLVRFGFHLLYNELAFTYDWVSWLVSLGQWRCWQRTVMPYLPPPQAGWALELAHGTGSLQVDLLGAQYRTIAFDLSPYMGRLATRKLTRRGLRTNFVRGNALHLPLMTGSISTLVCTFPTQFIIAPETLTEIHRILSKDGQALIVLTGQLCGRGLIHSFLESLYRITGQRQTLSAQAQMRHPFVGCGFDIETIEARCKDSAVQLVRLTKN